MKKKQTKTRPSSQKRSQREVIERLIRFEHLPYNPFRTRLYSVKELTTGYDPAHPGRSLDERIARHYLGRPKLGRDHPSVHEALAQRIHDHAIDSALYRYAQPTGSARRKLIGVMGGHGLTRDNALYTLITTLTWTLCREGLCVVTGGGPGAMEAANLGAYLSRYEIPLVMRALEILKQAPDYGRDSVGYIAAALKVRANYPEDSGQSLAIPTWAYSNEPTGQFSSAIGKYFANSIREDGLLAIASDGVIFAPGSEGTLQEIFQDACHNGYWTFGTRAPMVFLNDENSYFTKQPSIFDVVHAQAARRDPPYANLLAIFSKIGPIVEFIKAHPRVPKPGSLNARTFGLTNLKLE